jgi:hypothetical protein
MPIPIDRDEVLRLVAGRPGRRGTAGGRVRDEHIAGAISIPLEELDERAPRLLDRGRPVIVYCYDYQ